MISQTEGHRGQRAAAAGGKLEADFMKWVDSLPPELMSHSAATAAAAAGFESQRGINISPSHILRQHPPSFKALTEGRWERQPAAAAAAGV